MKAKPRLAIVPKPDERKQFEPDIAFQVHDHIEPGEYPAYCRSAQIYFDDHFRRWICAAQFDILDDAYIEVIARLTRFVNLGESEKPRATSRRSHYWRAWVDANGGQPPKRGDRITPQIFVRRMCRVEVVDVEKGFSQNTLSGDEVYSVVKRIVSWETGLGPGTNNQLPT